MQLSETLGEVAAVKHDGDEPIYTHWEKGRPRAHVQTKPAWIKDVGRGQF